jgi:hypothetical protein
MHKFLSIMIETFETLNPNAYERTPVRFYEFFRIFRLKYSNTVTLQQAVSMLHDAPEKKEINNVIDP